MEQQTDQIEEVRSLVIILSGTVNKLQEALTEVCNKVSDLEDSQKGSKPIFQSMAEQIMELSKKMDEFGNDEKAVKDVSNSPVTVKKEANKGSILNQFFMICIVG